MCGNVGGNWHPARSTFLLSITVGPAVSSHSSELLARCKLQAHRELHNHASINVIKPFESFIVVDELVTHLIWHQHIHTAALSAAASWGGGLLAVQVKPHPILKKPAALPMQQQTSRRRRSAVLAQTQRYVACMATNTPSGPQFHSNSNPTQQPHERSLFVRLQRLRDECITLHTEDNPYCKALIEAHLACLRMEGFNVSQSRLSVRMRSFAGCFSIAGCCICD